MKTKYKIVLFPTIFAIVFTTLSFLMVEQALLWLSLEIITIPVIYTVGYEMLMDKQRQKLNTRLDSIIEYSNTLEKQNLELEITNKYLKNKNNK